jgi:hypothetical protein
MRFWLGPHYSYSCSYSCYCYCYCFDDVDDDDQRRTKRNCFLNGVAARAKETIVTGWGLTLTRL